jgi:hypothetical protein
VPIVVFKAVFLAFIEQLMRNTRVKFLLKWGVKPAPYSWGFLKGDSKRDVGQLLTAQRNPDLESRPLSIGALHNYPDVARGKRARTRPQHSVHLLFYSFS